MFLAVAGRGAMRIGMIAPLELRVPPVAYGGIELVVSLLTDELVRRGHDVTLFASGDSVTDARLVSCSPTFLRGTDADRDTLNSMNVSACLARADSFDVIHNHSGYEGMALAGLASRPMLSTLHGWPDDEWPTVFAHYPGWYNALSWSSRRQLPFKPGFVGVIHNGLDIDSYPFNGNDGREDHLLFLSRISREKGAHLAISVARRLGRRLVLAGNVESHDEEYFRTSVLPEIDGDQVQYIGEVDYQRKRDVLQQPHCLLAPLTWDEPFGLFMVEAMACGTPVVGLDRGSVSEVVRHGETGFVVDTLEEMTAAVGRVDSIDRWQCRLDAQRRFDYRKMVDRYVAAYERVRSEAGVPVRPERRVATEMSAPAVGSLGRSER